MESGMRSAALGFRMVGVVRVLTRGGVRNEVRPTRPSVGYGWLGVQETKKPRDLFKKETYTKPGGQEAKKPRNSETQTPSKYESQEPRNYETETPRNKETNT